jgi:tRNA (cmo5U34)-methyltransferase
MKVQEFYNEISKEYSAMMDKAVPKYREMLMNLFHCLPNNFAPNNILELDCGTGNLTDYIVKRYPTSTITVVDISEQILKECKARFKSNSLINYHQTDFNDLNLEKNTFDLVTSSIAIHHLNDNDKQLLFSKINTYLKDGGVFVYVDQCKSSTHEIYQKNIDSWKIEASKLGSTEDNWKMWMDHQDQHDFHSTVVEQIKWLENAEFENVDIIWRSLLWAILYAEKQ